MADDTNPTGAADTEYVVIRPTGDLADSDLASPFEGEWRRRADLADQTGIDLDGPKGTVRALPTDDVEESPAGDRAQVYRVPDRDDEGSEPERH